MLTGLQFISGPSGSGKTTFCLDLHQRVVSEGMRPGGFISPGVFHAGRKVGIDVLNVWSGEQRRLANRYYDEPEGLFTRKWQFDEAVISWVNTFLAAQPPCDLLFLDEIGPVELEQGKGLLEATTLLDERIYRNVVLVIRPHLLAVARERWPWGRLNTFLE